MMSIKYIRILLLILSFLLLQVYNISAQQKVERVELAGRVVDEIGEPLIGVTIVAKNQPGFGTVTNVDGHFKIVVREYDVLEFSYLGYENLEMPVLKIKDPQSIVAQLHESSQKLDEVVVTASGLQRKVTLTGAVTNVSVKDMKSPGVNLSNSLAGVVPGIIATQSSGAPGEDFSEVTIRGVSTYGENRGVLVLVDKIERNLDEVAIEDIEDISILKDAASTAIYGARGANGVILITTRKGDKGKIRISGNVRVGYDRMGSSPKFSDAMTYATLANEARVGRYESPIYTDEELLIIQNGLDPELYPSVNWKDVMLKNGAPTYKANLNFSGGGDNATYYVSLGYINQEGVYKTNDKQNAYNTNKTYDRFNYRARVNMNLTRTTTLDVGVGGWLVNQTQPGTDTGDIWASFNKLTPLTLPRRYSDGRFPVTLDREGNLLMTPETLLSQTGYGTRWENKMETNLSVTQDFSFITEGLQATALIAFDTYNDNNIKRSKRPELWKAENKRDADGELIFINKPYRVAELMTQNSTTNGTRKYYGQMTLSYSRLFAEKHRVGAFMLGYAEENSKTNFGDDLIESIPQRNMALSGSVSYSFRDRYIFDFNFGYTGSENFEKGKQYGFFPAPSLAWVISEESFIKNNIKWLDMLKVRASYGEVGNDRIGGNTRFPYVTLIGSSSAGYAFGENGTNYFNGYRLSRIGTPHLTWEVAKKYDLGIDLSLLNGMFTGTVDFFKDNRDDIFMQRNHMPLTTGLADRVPMANVGKMKSTGFDGIVTFVKRVDKVDLRLSANVTYQNTEIIDKDEAANELWYKMDKGFRMDQTRGFIALGLFKDQADIDNSPKQDLGRTPLPGDIKYKDVNGDGVINDDDVVPLGYKSRPGLQYGTTINVGWNNFELNILFQGSGKRDFFVGGSGPHAFSHGSSGNILEVMSKGNRWIPREVSGTAETENPDAEWPRLTWGNNNNNNLRSTFWLRDGKYIRLRNLELAYNIPATVLRRFYVSSMRVGFLGENLATWSPFKWWDPESGREDGANYPISKKFHFYVNFSF